MSTDPSYDAHGLVSRDMGDRDDAIQRLRERFRQAHADGMAALERGDVMGLSLAVERERALIEELRTLIERQKNEEAKG